MLFPHELDQLAFAEDGVGQIQARELDLLRAENAKLLDEPFVERAVILEFERADRMGDALNRVALPMRPIVHRVNAPLVARARMMRVQDAIKHRIAQIQVAGTHVDLRAQHAFTVFEFTLAHPLKQVEIFLNRAVAIGAFLAGFGQCPAIFADFFLRQVIDIRLAILNQLDRPLIKLSEVVRGEVQFFPVKAEPAHIVHDRVDVFLFFFGGVGIVKTQIGLAVVIVGDAEIQADRFGMTDMQIPVGFRRKTGIHTPAEASRLIVFVNNLADEIRFAAKLIVCIVICFLFHRVLVRISLLPVGLFKETVLYHHAAEIEGARQSELTCPASRD